MFASLLFLSKRYHRLYLSALVISFALFSITFSSCEHEKRSSVEFTTGDFPQEVYVWQRVWTDEVKSAIETRAPEFDNTIFLAAEISYNQHDQQWNCQPFQHSLKHCQQNSEKFGLAFRIHTNASKSRWTPDASEAVIQYLRSHTTDATSIQIDYDCPSKKLADYTKLLIQIRKEFPNKTLEITCLPDWLNYSEFVKLIQQTDRFIMQVHGVSGHGKGRALCNTDHAHRTALSCAEFGKPYLIALPTYRHAINYDNDGKLRSIASEGRYQKASYEISSADPFQLSLLIQHWQEQRPALMQGIIWYRLPVSTDRMNWTWDTFQKVRHGETLKLSNLDLEISPTENGLHHLTMTNNSKQRLDYPEKIRLDWQGFCIAIDLTDQFITEKLERSKGISIDWKKTSPYPIAPGETINIGSFRFTENSPTIEITTP